MSAAHDAREAADWRLAGDVTTHALDRATTALSVARARHAAAEGPPTP